MDFSCEFLVVTGGSQKWLMGKFRPGKPFELVVRIKVSGRFSHQPTREPVISQESDAENHRFSIGESSQTANIVFSTSMSV